MDAPLAPKTHAVVVALLMKLGESHPETVADTARTLRSFHGMEKRIVRIESGAYCEAARCLTLILSDDEAATPSVAAMVYAGKNVGLPEPRDDLFGSGICFSTDKPELRDIVCLSKTAIGWIVR